MFSNNRKIAVQISIQIYTVSIRHFKIESWLKYKQHFIFDYLESYLTSLDDLNCLHENLEVIGYNIPGTVFDPY